MTDSTASSYRPPPSLAACPPVCVLLRNLIPSLVTETERGCEAFRGS